ncbi:hypothetical protein AB1Y20_005873 [Prymnesium parvum]|uniref:U3 small nucleolar RNA-associated protein 11 n=1 Tax=Prymnesium parvum TaxID=97485 RepID=A0AB34J2U6_PRYPA|mmetsp:Transcript_18364/g.45985  ORF Transcript_18364/g.45985 Transcript_18364/m.45985 type:complete len:267 (+) Transcript_18364:295-1095(+)|eukprot:CAMPEP_0182823818 /NCGR_PEP_ID=MMETSP0006_2-20121128/14958_1 /TAXON_ID=97485 /ORGANISM="Prymnesium parvum, Strain Texoma1" /LENGTH=266 /DNA_ID=CAMNT_0024950771 /DNA_START=211 /DNA_END=1011 /DNA_ORIENTATION=+
MSSLKNLVKTRTYRERAQPAARKNLGLLEKKKDYKLRANDFHRKQEALKVLQEKAAFKNPDEFYYKMVHTKMQDGVHTGRKEAPPSADDLKAFKKEDASYLNTKRQAEARKIEKLRATLHEVDAPAQNKHTVFIDSKEEAKDLDLVEHFDTPAELLSRAKHRPRRNSRTVQTVDSRGWGYLPSQNVPAVNELHTSALPKRLATKAEKSRAAKYSELTQREERHRKMARTLERIGIEKALLGKGRVKKLKGKDGELRQYKWRQERKK